MALLQVNTNWAVEEIQDLIEKALYQAGHFEVMSSFMLYRHTRKPQREHIAGLKIFATSMVDTPVVFSGGECTIHSQIIPFAREVKAMGFEVKIDTNGRRPEVLRQLGEEKLVDYVALDFMAMAGNYWEITRSDLFLAFEKSLEILLTSFFRFEVRTTVHSGLLSHRDLDQMENWLKEKGYTGSYFLQHFRGDKKTLGGVGESRNADYKIESSVWRN
ncbi:ATP cone domain-containing protein [Algoriphagus persicinus]|uniref:ATP cone domain-containing protein n=1 Tax=Algoriphagus persicinus TaxID=3108754 RepID=UPI002B3D812B|nr:ATP cone domain-containing protein [Algoriphagus sp. E1-3-M2]MEB2785337.1 hypothetical protein [Algoriphagus sp. E1-3-M2]